MSCLGLKWLYTEQVPEGDWFPQSSHDGATALHMLQARKAQPAETNKEKIGAPLSGEREAAC